MGKVTIDKKVLRYEIVEATETRFELKIVEQSHITDSFGERGNYHWVAPNGVILTSVGCPAFYDERNPIRIYVRGGNEEDKTTTFALPVDVFAKFHNAVKAYNEHFVGREVDEKTYSEFTTVHDVARDNLLQWKKIFEAEWHPAFIDLLNAKDLDEAILLKGRLIMRLLKLPLKGNTCHSCIMANQLDFSCSMCDYGKEHKICELEGSDYANMKFALKELQKAVQKAYIGVKEEK